MRFASSRWTTDHTRCAFSSSIPCRSHHAMTARHGTAPYTVRVQIVSPAIPLAMAIGRSVVRSCHASTQIATVS